MLRYVLRRLLLALPTLLVITLITFGLSKCAPGDPVSRIYGENLSGSLDPEAQARSYAENARKLGLDKPVFYFSIQSDILPDTLHLVFPAERRKRLSGLALQCGDWSLVDRYEKQLAVCIRTFEGMPDTAFSSSASLRLALSGFVSLYDKKDMFRALDSLSTAAYTIEDKNMPLVGQISALNDLAVQIDQRSNTSLLPVPSFHWHGADNQYHHWLTGILRADFGVSYALGKPTVWSALSCYIPPTLLLNGLALLLAYLLAVPLGVDMVRQQGRQSEKWTRRGLLFLYALPTFWLGSMLILWLATPGYGLHLIHGIPLGSPWCGSNKPFVTWVVENADKFVLPVLTLTLHALAVLAMQMRGGMLAVIGQDFIRTARAKGVPEDLVYWRHAFRNALFPIITVFASVFPAIFAGSLVVEYMFGFPGMGLKTQEAFNSRDFPVLFAIMLLSAVLTVIGSLLSDILFALADPRVRFGAKE